MTLINLEKVKMILTKMETKKEQYDKEQKTNKSRKNEEYAKKPWDLMKILIKNEEDTKKVWTLDEHKLSQKTVNK